MKFIAIALIVLFSSILPSYAAQITMQYGSGIYWSDVRDDIDDNFTELYAPLPTKITNETGATGTISATEMNGVVYTSYAGSTTQTLTSTASLDLGDVVCIYSTVAQDLIVDVGNASDEITLDGVAIGAGDKIKSAGAIGDYICLQYSATNVWRTFGRSGTWTDDGA